MSYMKGLSAQVGDEENANETSKVLPVVDANNKFQKAAVSKRRLI